MKNLAKYSVLHVDDDVLELRRVEQQFRKDSDAYSFEIISANGPDQLRTLLRDAKEPDALLLDIHFKGSIETGIDLIDEVRSHWPATAIVVRSSDETLVWTALSHGADDFIAKDGFEGEIVLRTARAIVLVQERRGLNTTRSFAVTSASVEVVGSMMQLVAKRCARIIESGVRAVHVFGESGTGKEIVADLFESTLGGTKPFVRINCGGIPENLFEGELFGAAKGAYTGALKDRAGLIEGANGGFLYLDEIGSIPLASQVKLLRLLDNQELKRLGENKVRKIDVRVISATNEDLRAKVERGEFRNDLLQRLSEAEIHLPPLRERMDEIPALVQFFCQRAEGGPYRITDSAVSILNAYNWEKGNVRELRNCVRAMTENHIEKLLTPLSIPKTFWERLPDDSDVQDQKNQGEAAPQMVQSPAKGSSGAGVVPINLVWEAGRQQPYSDLSEILLWEMIKHICKSPGNQSLRFVASQIGLGRVTIAERLRRMVQKGLLSSEDLQNMVNIKA